MSQDVVADSIEQLLREVCTPRQVRAVEAGDPGAAMWRELHASGFADALVPESSGGAGLGLTGVFPAVVGCGRHAVPLPFPETMVARAALATEQVPPPEGPITIASGTTAAGERSVSCDRVPYGRVAEWVLVDLGTSAALLPAAAAEVTPTGIRGNLEAAMRWPDPGSAAGAVRARHDWRAIGACLYAAQLAGAMERVLEITIAYANERQQFGKPIGKFQAIQQQLSVASEHVFASRMAARIGCHGPSFVPDRLCAAAAKARTSEAAGLVAAIAHAVHGANGITEEYDLQLYTRRLQEWRLTWGSESRWNAVLGEAIVAGTTSFADFVRERLFPF